MIIIVTRFFLFVCLLFKGIMPWHQIHAWNILVKTIECYYEHKADTIIAIVVSVLMQLPDKVAGKDAHSGVQDANTDEIGEVTLDDLAKVVKENNGLLCNEALSSFLKTFYSMTVHDQECLVATFSLLTKQKADAGWFSKVVGGVASLICKVNIRSGQENLIIVANTILDKIIKFACDNNEKEVAYECVRLQQMTSDLRDTRIHSRNGNKITLKINSIAEQLNKVGAMLRVMVEFNMTKQEIKLLEYRKTTIHPSTT